MLRAGLAHHPVKVMTPWLVGMNPLHTERIWQEVYACLRDHGQKGAVIEGLSGVDIALWDIKGKFFGGPAYVLMGGPLRTKCGHMRPACTDVNRAIRCSICRRKPPNMWPMASAA
ncbi:mandelate racemase/muconate lactonizing enzyme family protein [Candidatus Paraburkholderia calva]|nr:mandelate racemase/muconate lactonizing enzyme family protein [Candidatus Paraburkholderia calva]